jgi:hypothetical protein
MGFLGALKALGGIAKTKAMNKAKSGSGGTPVPQSVSTPASIGSPAGQQQTPWENVPKTRKDR